jgi:pantetheine-phosphate adenylyltransferase
MIMKTLQENDIDDYIAKIMSPCGPYKVIDDIMNRYNEPHRHYHTWQHIRNMVKYLYDNGNYDPTFVIAAVLHDAVYDTRSKTNEEESATLVDSLILPIKAKQKIKDLILFTKYDQPIQATANASRSDICDFLLADLDILNADYDKLMQFEQQIFKEYYWVNVKDYIEGRIKILQHLTQLYDYDNSRLINYHNCKQWKIGFYPGTFYPFHVGHQSILSQAEQLFDKVIIGVNEPSSKTNFKWDPDYGELNECITSKNQTFSIAGLITDSIQELKKTLPQQSTVTIIRGLRNSSDLIYEQNYAQTLKNIDDVNFVYFNTEPQHQHVSSSMVRELLRLSPKDALKYINN